jgi:cytoskeleton protein RodZ
MRLFLSDSRPPRGSIRRRIERYLEAAEYGTVDMSANDPTSDLPPLGAALAAAREASGRSTADVAAALKLRLVLVEGIERDDFSGCGGDVYARWHVRDYARLLGLDDGPLLEAYAVRQSATRAQPQPDSQAESRPPAHRSRATRASRPAEPATGVHAGVGTGPVPPLHLSGPGIPTGPRKPPWSLLAGVALTGLVAFLTVQLVAELRAPARPALEVAAPVTPSATQPSPRPSSSSPSQTAAAPRPTTPKVRPAPSASEQPAKAPVEGVAIALRATGDSWVTVRAASGRTKFAGLLGKGEHRKFTDADGLRVVLGNAGGVQLTVNGQRVGESWRDGEVKRLTIKPGDPA